MGGPHGCQLLPILMLKQLFPSPLIYLILMLHLSIFINHTVEIGPLHSTLLPARHRWENKIPAFTQLRQIIDPLRYLNTIYQPRLAIPKYIINASGDDFFVPDNTRFYYSKLPGVKSLRIVPNMNHYSINQFAEGSLVPFINRFQSKKTLPQLIDLIHHHLLTVYFSEAPVKVVRWTANNPNARDFRYACGIRYQPLTIDSPSTIRSVLR